ncbi:DUF1810 domain-containing protein [Sphingomonas qomolangmaensis]|uniref:DUF1810 domain-containing protein n=1 Tax=Sphingomonas qomolangmaensis TaxID=2918765 RepID=A0ABY5LHD1_9SPHN|nr:DUF1810 domain-containing protein [Sphingomonas qomolangmaensis]UUL84151.1 DUF1810 domain-containing protein [Sphingomonas qomolangmaensis]
MTGGFNLDRFVLAQREVYATALAEIGEGRKRSHWMWFIFPQIAGLGRSDIAQHYAIASRAEAIAYLAHPMLGPRLLACVSALQQLPEPADAAAVFGAVDALKLRSSLTLFAAAGGSPIFGEAIDRWFGGQADGITLETLAAPP